LRVTTAEQAAARDQSAIADGVASFSLMLDAGTAMAAVILRDYPDRLSRGGRIRRHRQQWRRCIRGGRAAGARWCAGASGGRRAPRTADAQRAAAIAERGADGRITREPSEGDGSHGEASDGDERLVVDGLLGTGHRGPLREPIARLCAALAASSARRHRAALDAVGTRRHDGERAAASVAAHVTVTYGTIKRGLLAARAQAGRLVLLDIGLGAHARLDDDAWQLASARVLSNRLPAIEWDAHKGRRGHLALVGGATGMAGAIVLATRAALRSGIGLARGFVEGDGVSALQRAVPQAIAGTWTLPEDMPRADALAIGPGLGRSDGSRNILRAMLDAWRRSRRCSSMPTR
jgi:NAD(P)H-hydrate epimerase